MSDFSQWKYALVAYALKGQMNINVVTDYLQRVIGLQMLGDTPEMTMNRNVAQNMEERKDTPAYNGSWYVREDAGEYRLDCSGDLKSRLLYVKYAKYGKKSKRGNRVFDQYDFNNIIKEFIRRDRMLNSKTIFEICLSEEKPENPKPKFNSIEKIIDDTLDSREKLSSYPASLQYTKQDFLRQVYITNEKYDELRGLLEYKKNVILQGAPGVGKTYAAERLAYSILGKRDQKHILKIQFHQSYSYDDFIMGYKPSANGFKLTEGIFYNFCETASASSEPYFLIIDEINRGNLSKIFGELLMLIESDYRDTTLQLPFEIKKIRVPKNLFIIGMMNTADRSLAMIDYALRRRFAFFDMIPAFDSSGFLQHERKLDSVKFSNIINIIRQLNNEIKNDPTLGDGFCIGHSYFCNPPANQNIDAWLKAVVNFEIIPMLKEYWFDNKAKIDEWDSKLQGTLR